MTVMHDLVTPSASTLARLESDLAVLIPETRLHDTYRDIRIGKVVREALARQLPTSAPSEAVRFLCVSGHVLLANLRNVAAL